MSYPPPLRTSLTWDFPPGQDEPIIAIALDGAGWHPAAWREPSARVADLYSASYWIECVQRADIAHADLVTIDDDLGPRDAAAGRSEHIRTRLDALLIAARVATETRRVGLIPTVTTTHTEPFHVATALQTLDWASHGRAGWQVRVSHSPVHSAQFGRRDLADFHPEARGALFAEAREAVEIARRLWDSWEDDAIIRDTASGRFLDRERVHPIRFHGDHLAVEGASITPRSPQGQPLVAVLAHVDDADTLAASSADLVFTTPLASGSDDAVDVLRRVRSAERRTGRDGAWFDGRPLAVLADLTVIVDDRPGEAGRILERLDERSGEAFVSDAHVVAGSAAEVIDVARDLISRGYSGVRFRPARIPADLDALATSVLPALAGRPRSGSTLRERLGAGRPASRYAPRHNSERRSSSSSSDRISEGSIA